MPLPTVREAEQIMKALNGVKGVIEWLKARGVQKERILALLDVAESAGRDVSEGEVSAILDATDADIQTVRAKIKADNEAKAKADSTDKAPTAKK